MKTMTETYRRVPNQENREDIKQPYLYIEWESVDTAKRNLSANAFILWLYLVRYNDNVKCSFSMREFCKWAGLPYSTGARAKKELLDNGYLVPVEGKKSDFDFYECPQQFKEIIEETNNITIHRTSGTSPRADGFVF